VPIVKVYHQASVSEDQLRDIVDALRQSVPRALDCADETFDGVLQPGDLNVIVSPQLTPIGGLSVVVEVRTRHYPSRAANRDERAAAIRQAVAQAYAGSVGVWLGLEVAGWSQTGAGEAVRDDA